MLHRSCALLFFILILVFLLIFPGVILAENTSTQDTTSSTQQNNNHFRVEVSKNGFNNTSEELRLEVQEGQEVEITFVYADDASNDNPHIIYIGGYKIQTEILSKDNPEITVKFTANKTGEFPITCIMECAGHHNLQGGKLVVLPAAESEPGIKSTVTLALNAPDQAETGQSLTLTAIVKNDLDEPFAGAQVNFFVETDFFVKGLIEIGEGITDEQGLAKIEYTPDQAGVLRVVARYTAGSGLEPVETEKEVNITGSGRSFYQSRIGIQFPHSLLIWMISIVITLFAVWGTFLYVLYQVQYISRGTVTRGIPLILMIVVATLFIILVLVLTTPESQYNFGLLP